MIPQLGPKRPYGVVFVFKFFELDCSRHNKIWNDNPVMCPTAVETSNCLAMSHLIWIWLMIMSERDSQLDSGQRRTPLSRMTADKKKSWASLGWKGTIGTVLRWWHGILLLSDIKPCGFSWQMHTCEISPAFYGLAHGAGTFVTAVVLRYCATGLGGRCFSNYPPTNRNTRIPDVGVGR